MWCTGSNPRATGAATTSRGWVARQVAAGLTTHRLGPVSRLAFVCTHNSARSQLAAAHWNGHYPALPAVSAGTHPAVAVHPRAIALARRVGLPLNSTGTRTSAATAAKSRRGQFAVTSASYATPGADNDPFSTSGG